MSPTLAVLVLTLLLAVAGPGAAPAAHAQAFDRSHLPFKNWGGFSVYRDASTTTWSAW